MTFLERCRYLFFVGLLPVGLFLSACEENKKTPAIPQREAGYAVLDPQRVHKKAAQLQQYAAAHGYNTQYALLIDFRVFSGNPRFVCYDLRRRRILSKGLVCHGQGPDYRVEKPVFSNVNGSRCSSLGRYRIGGKYNGRFGTAYKLYGLDSSNSRAFERFVVLHGHACVPEEAQLQGLCRSDGCPTLNPAYFETVQTYLDKPGKPVLLWIYH
ncbi:murein L,D-transpeptidase catalytic domain family protein [Chitinophaga nivalis]|uniref:Murein L,D-transpeptidase catalytic domain family protein n=1 Tax=Chitinophaga nivalis TaxID=2991709 RepID=A0ABT3IKR9_9BACT|nr:murein L,D-transpeptidase catalytic domain family protein [Chitinophaga nivalis]MCW3465760.1 murein L,D-transpeptidase catalytic domain family protein [Chitinophaga nivalis]MCW3484549.1 murein L,D-transpeptidase catalytic domain family protein [Chitinophaga nivalis]